jgi:hypothetical protein
MADLPIVPSDLSTLDRGLLEALVIAQQKQMLAKDEFIAAHHEKLLSRDNEIEHLKLVIAKLRRMMIVGTRSVRRGSGLSGLLERASGHLAEKSPSRTLWPPSDLARTRRHATFPESRLYGQVAKT